MLIVKYYVVCINCVFKKSSACFFGIPQNDIETVDPRGRTPLHLAVSLGHMESVRVLLRHGAQVTKENANNWTG